MHSTHCLNCGVALRPEFRYCPDCGQDTHLHRLNLAHIGHELLHFFTHADKGIFFLIRSLLTRTGAVAQEYIAGQRKKYFSPLNFFLIAVGFFVFMLSTFHPTQSVDLSMVKAEVEKLPDPVERERKLVKLERLEFATNLVSKYANIINFVLAPLFAFFFYLLFVRGRYNYTEHLVANFYITGMNALFFCIVVAPLLLLLRNSKFYFAGLGIYFLWEVVYRTIFYHRFMGKQKLKHLLAPLALSVVLNIAWFSLSRFFIGRYVETGHFL